ERTRGAVERSLSAAAPQGVPAPGGQTSSRAWSSGVAARGSRGRCRVIVRRAGRCDAECRSCVFRGVPCGPNIAPRPGVVAPRTARGGATRPEWRDMFAQTSLPRGERIGIAIMIGIGAAALSYLTLRMYPQFVARDYTYSWRAAQALLHGQNPYLVIRPTRPYPYENYYYY